MRRKESSTPSAEKSSLNLPDYSESGRERTVSETKSESEAKEVAIPPADIAQAKAVENEQAVEDTPMSDGPAPAADQPPEAIKQDPANVQAATNVQHVLSSLQQMHNKQDLGHI